MEKPKDRFSRRYGLGRQHDGPLIYHDAPKRLRAGILALIRDELYKPPAWIRRIICGVRRDKPAPSNWSEYPIWEEAQRLVYGAEWYEFYDFVEACARDEERAGRLDQFEIAVNRLFDEEHIGWRLIGGVLEAHGDDTLEAVIGRPEEELEESGFRVAAKEFHEARADLSRRPEPDLSGAVHHAMVALESVAREVSGDPKPTLGKIIGKNPGLLPSPVDKAAEMLWGFASEQARHGKETRQLDWPETLLIVGLAGTLCSYLIAKTENKP